MNYGDIMVRISELIQKGQNGKNNGVGKVASVKGYYVLESDAPEFCELLALENTFYLLNTTENPTLKNDNLLKLCQERASVDDEYTNDYLALMEILHNAYGKQASELSEHLGYYIPKESIILFHNICKRLKVGTSAIIRNMDSQEAKDTLYDSVRNRSLQFERIKNYFLKHFNQNIERATLVQEKKNPRDFMEIISLGIDGHLTIEMVASLRSRLSAEDFKKLLCKLTAFNVFNNEELSKIDSLIDTGEKEILNLDELVIFLASREQLNLEFLKYLVPEIGIYNYQYVIDELFKLGIINIDDYIKAIKEYLGENDSISVANYIGIINEYIVGDPKR